MAEPSTARHEAQRGDSGFAEATAFCSFAMDWSRACSFLFIVDKSIHTLICNSCHFPSFRAKPIEKQMDFYIMILTNEGKNQTGKEEIRVLYCIAVLIDKGQKGQDYAEYILNYCADRKIFPLVQIYQDQEKFFGEIQKTIPSIVLLALQGVAGLNAAEHLRSLHPKCKMIWCSDLDFSLHAFKLRVEYFFMEPVEEQKLWEGLTACFGRR